MGLVDIFGEDNLRYLLLWSIFYGLYVYFFNVTLLSLISFFLIFLVILKAVFIVILSFAAPTHNNPIHKAESRALSQDGMVDSIHSLINGSLNRFGQMIRNTSMIELVLVGLTLYLLKLLFKNISNSLAVFLIVVMVLLSQGFMKLLGPTITRLNNWFDSGRDLASSQARNNRRYD